MHVDHRDYYDFVRFAFSFEMLAITNSIKINKCKDKESSTERHCDSDGNNKEVDWK